MTRWMLLCAPLAFCQEPALPFHDWGACPYEKCLYSEQWTAQRPVTVYDSWKEGRKAIAQMGPGDKATGVRGLVITSKPGVVLMDRDLPERGLRRGDTLLTYAYRGEGWWAVSINGKYAEAYDLTFVKLLDGTGCGGAHCAAHHVEGGSKSWWAEVKLVSGKTGWVDMELGKATVAMY